VNKTTMGPIARTINKGLGDLSLDRHSCQLLGPTALVVQSLMGLLAVLSLVYKRHRETQKRPWNIWLYDVSKQVVGQLFCHGLNVLISDLGSHQSAGNACSYYFLNIFLDTTLGVGMIYLVLHCSAWLLSGKLGIKGLKTGQYGNPPLITYWVRQAAVYIFAITAMKFLVVVMFAVWPSISLVGDWLLSWTIGGAGDSVEVVFVMGIFPIFMNILQFWLIDSIVKASTTSDAARPSPRNSDAGDREPLFNSPDDDDVPDLEHGARTSRTTSQGDFETLLGTEDTKAKLSASRSSSPMTLPTTPVMVAHDYPPNSVGSVSSQGSTRPRHKYKRFPSSVLDLSIPYSAPAGNTFDTTHDPLQLLEDAGATLDDVAEFDAWEKSGWVGGKRRSERGSSR